MVDAIVFAKQQPLGLLCEGTNASMVYMSEDRATYKQGSIL